MMKARTFTWDSVSDRDELDTAFHALADRMEHKMQKRIVHIVAVVLFDDTTIAAQLWGGASDMTDAEAQETCVTLCAALAVRGTM